jgi:HK97 gp10 family phage protein
MPYVESGVYIDGLNEMVAGLKAISSEATKEVSALNLKVAKMVKEESKILAPVGKVNGGALRDSIRTSKSLYGAFVYAGRTPNIPYANVQNWGWFYDKKNFIYKNIKPQQFMNKAAAKVRGQLKDFYIQELIQIYNKYSKKPSNIKVNDYINQTGQSTVGRRYR